MNDTYEHPIFALSRRLLVSRTKLEAIVTANAVTEFAAPTPPTEN
jgi:hypothetical protein